MQYLFVLISHRACVYVRVCVCVSLCVKELNRDTLRMCIRVCSNNIYVFINPQLLLPKTGQAIILVIKSYGSITRFNLRLRDRSIKIHNTWLTSIWYETILSNKKKGRRRRMNQKWICLEPTHFCVVLITVYGSFSTGLDSNTNFEYSTQTHTCTGMQHVTWVDKNETKRYETPQVKRKNRQ